MLHPDFPIIEGRYQMTREWSVLLPEQFNRRIEDGDLIIWKPSFTIHVAAWGNDDNKATNEQLTWIKDGISEEATNLGEDSRDGILLFKYRLIEDSDDNRVPGYYCYAIAKSGYVQMAIYFNSESDESIADSIWQSLEVSHAS